MNEKKIVYKPKYLSQEDLEKIRNFYHVKINDSIYHSAGPYSDEKNELGWEGCWDRNLHLEILDNPIHKLIDKLKNEFGQFEIDSCSIRYLSAPFLPHSDVVSVEWIENLKKLNHKEGWIFLIPLSFVNGYVPGTAFFSCPPRLSEPLYSEMLDILPKFNNQYRKEMKNFSVKKIVKWESAGDLIAWENYQYHGSCDFGNVVYDRQSWVKEFISIKTYIIQ
jgi:hypothetical protein